VGSTSSALPQTVNKAKTTTSLVSSTNPSIKGQSVTFTATVHPAFGGAPSGKVTFKNGAVILGSVVVNATTHQVKFTTSKLSVGTHSRARAGSESVHEGGLIRAALAFSV
jgi:Bacterial Ig-like domain (group 3)